MISARPEPEKVDMEEYLNAQVKVLNTGENVLDVVKSLPITKSSKKIIIGFLEKKKPEKISGFCEYLGLSDEHIKQVDDSVKNFIDVGGLSGLHIASNYATFRKISENYNYEDSQPEEGTYGDYAQKRRIKERKE